MLAGNLVTWSNSISRIPQALDFTRRDDHMDVALIYSLPILQNSIPNLISRRPPPLICPIPPALTTFVFASVGEYHLGRPNSPNWCPYPSQLPLFRFYYRPYYTSQFIHHAKTFNAPVDAAAYFDLTLFASTSSFALRLQCTGLDRPLSLFEQIYSPCVCPSSLMSYSKYLTAIRNRMSKT